MEDEYAPLHPPARVRRALALLLWGALAFLLLDAGWLTPWFRWFAQTSDCQEYLGIAGGTLAIYGSLVGLPVLILLVYLAFAAPLAIQVIRHRRYPPPGWKTYARTKIIRDRAALQLGWIWLAAFPLGLLGVTLYMASQAPQFVEMAPPRNPRSAQACASALAQRPSYGLPALEAEFSLYRPSPAP